MFCKPPSPRGYVGGALERTNQHRCFRPRTGSKFRDGRHSLNATVLARGTKACFLPSGFPPGISGRCLADRSARIRKLRSTKGHHSWLRRRWWPKLQKSNSLPSQCAPKCGKKRGRHTICISHRCRCDAKFCSKKTLIIFENWRQIAGFPDSGLALKVGRGPISQIATQVHILVRRDFSSLFLQKTNLESPNLEQALPKCVPESRSDLFEPKSVFSLNSF